MYLSRRGRWLASLANAAYKRSSLPASQSIRFNLKPNNTMQNFVRPFSVSSMLFNQEAAAADMSLTMKRSKKRRYALQEPDAFEPGRYPVSAYATAKEFNLEALRAALYGDSLYKPIKMADGDSADVLLAVATYKVADEPRHIFFFREGAVVFWNCTDMEIGNVLAFLKKFQLESYNERIVFRENELMSYKYQTQGKNCQLRDSIFMLSPDPENLLEKYTFSNAMAQSVKLGIWEATLDDFADSLATITDDLERGKPIKISRAEALKKTGSLFALRHSINLDSDLLDTPDFYWERAELEKLFGETAAYFSISRRTRVLNERLSHCAGLVELVGARLDDRHHVRLEWMIIILIMVEVGFEMLHFVERYHSHPEIEDSE